ncbi:hypothetical protein MHPYR_280061 [uncultured Mycobacterium sp.]|uniref:Uncharacterized protein n=1 Tax=uncultured Mycobacterium sp. TaxID=171292 RepID=A0A1Y5PB33_9MYCO|nr:hypothetical protein MHPYR_280061 [uncultured Mycobacterium sp.]
MWARRLALLGALFLVVMQYGWNELADSAKFVVAYPEGVGESWNAGAAGHFFAAHPA